MESFRAAIDVLFADPNLAEKALWKAGASAPGIAVPVIRKSPDIRDSFGDTRVVLPTVVLDVRKADVETPCEGDLIESGSDVVKVIGAPMIDRLGLVWTCEAVKV